MKTNFRKLLSVVLSLVMILACLTSISITTLAEETTTDEVVVKKGPFDFTDATDLAYGNGATVENGKVKINIKNANGAAWMRIPYEIVSGTDYSVRFKIKVIATGWMNLTLKTAYAQGNGVGFEHTNAAHIASKIDYPNTITKNEWTDIEYNFTANNPTEGDYKYLGLFIQTSVASEIYIDNIQIEPVLDKYALYDFSDASHLEFGSGSDHGKISVADGELKSSFAYEWHNVEAKFPFVLQDGKEYKVKFEIRSDIENAGGSSVWGGYAGPNDSNVIKDSSESTHMFGKYAYSGGTDVKTVEYSFTAKIPESGYNQFGIRIVSVAVGNIYIDNLEISLLEANSASFDFANVGDLESYKGTYNQGSAKVEDGALNISVPTNGYRVNATFPFILQDGKEYKLSFDVTSNTDQNFGIYFAYNNKPMTTDSPSKRIQIHYGSFTTGTRTMECTFTAEIPEDGYNRLGLMFFANNANLALTVDNLEISIVDTEKVYYDFSNASQLQYGYATYNANGVSVQDGMVKATLGGVYYRGFLKFPFTLETGETYKVRFDVKADIAKQDEVYIAYAGANNAESTINYGSDLIDGGFEGLGNDYRTLEYTFTANCPTNCENFGIFLRAGSAGANTIYIDNLYIVKDYLVADTPNAPDMASHTENSVTLMDMRGYEYKIDDGEWQTSPVFENLVQGQTYSFYQRAAATDYYPATAASEALVYFIANYGDADRDGNIAAADLTLMRNVLMDSKEVYDEFAADLNKNGVLDVVDLVKLKKELAQKKNPVTPEFLGENYEIAWYDEFDSNTLDKSKWNTGTYTIADNGYDGVTHIAKNNNAGVLEVADGYLKLHNYAVANENGGTDYYTSEIATNKTYNFSYGYFEMRAKLASGNPLWHSFWACGQNTEEEPYRAEVDVIETNFYGANLGTYDYTVHSWWDKNAANLPDFMATNTDGHKGLLNGKVSNNTLASEFHNYGCLWTETSITFYLDGEVLKEVKFADDANSDYFLALKEGNPMFLVLSLSTAREYAGTINNDTLSSQQMLVDYVRVYQDTTIGD